MAMKIDFASSGTRQFPSCAVAESEDPLYSLQRCTWLFFPPSAQASGLGSDKQPEERERICMFGCHCSFRTSMLLPIYQSFFQDS